MSKIELPKGPNGEYQDSLLAGKIYGFHLEHKYVLPLEAIVHELPRGVIAIRGVSEHAYEQVTYVPTKAVDSRSTMGPTAGVSAATGQPPDIDADKHWGETNELSLSQQAAILEQAAQRMGGWHMIQPKVNKADKPRNRVKKSTEKTTVAPPVPPVPPVPPEGSGVSTGLEGLDDLLANT